MYSLIPPNTPFVDSPDEPTQFSQGTLYLRYMLKWALTELDYQSQRAAITLSFDHPYDYLQFLTNEFNPRLLALHNILPSLSSFPSGNTEADVYLRNKLRRSFEDVLEEFLAVNQRLFVSKLLIFKIHQPSKLGLLKQVATDFLSLWKGIFEQILSLTEDPQQVKAHANADGNVTLNLKIDAPASYQQLIDWLTEQARFVNLLNNTEHNNITTVTENIPAISDFATGIVGVSVILLGLGVFIHFLPMSLWAALLIGIVWFFYKNPFALLGALLGISLGS